MMSGFTTQDLGSKPALLGLITGLLLMTPVPARAASVPRSFCGEYAVDYDDALSSIHDDDFTDLTDKPARGVRIRVLRNSDLGVIFDTFATVGADGNCTASMTLDTAQSYTVRLYSVASIDGDNTVTVRDATTDNLIYDTLWSAYTPTLHGALTVTASTGLSAVWDIAAAAGWAIHKHPAGITGESFLFHSNASKNVFHENSGDPYIEILAPVNQPDKSSGLTGAPSLAGKDSVPPRIARDTRAPLSAPLDERRAPPAPSVPANCPGNHPDLIGPEILDNTSKYIIVHEMGHWMEFAGNGRTLGTIAQDYSEPGTTCPPGGTLVNHKLNSTEYQKAAFIEGYASFYAQVAFNDLADRDCYYWRDGVDWDLDGSLVLDTEQPSCESGPYAYPLFGSIDSYDYLGDYCLATGVSNNRGTQYDWMRFFWDLASDEGLTYLNTMQIMDLADPEGWEKTGDGTGSGYPATELEAAATTLGFGTAWNNQDNLNGVDR